MLDQDAHVINTGPTPKWIEPAFRVTAGRDPLSLQTITIDRIMPRLVPAILALSRRARYLSYYPFLLAEYQDRQKEPTRTGWSRFVKHREYEFAVAMQLCPRGCGKRASAIVGQDRAGPDARTLTSLLPRRESVESDNGGYGLYYRTPLIDLGIVAPAGTPFGPEDELTPIDIVANAQGRQLADQFRSAISGTRYYREFFNGTQDIPRTVLEDLAEVGCLCRLEEFPEERAAIRSALLETPDLSSLALVSQEIRLSEVDQRRRSVALILSALGQDPAIAAGPKHDSALRTVIWRDFEEHRKDEGPLAETVGQWAACCEGRNAGRLVVNLVRLLP